MTLEDVTLVGCGFAECDGTRYPRNYACIYAWIPNVIQNFPRPWKQGPSCSECDKGDCDGNLCDVGPNILFKGDNCASPQSGSCRYWGKDKCYRWTNVAPNCHRMC